MKMNNWPILILLQCFIYKTQIDLLHDYTYYWFMFLYFPVSDFDEWIWPSQFERHFLTSMAYWYIIDGILELRYLWYKCVYYIFSTQLWFGKGPDDANQCKGQWVKLFWSIHLFYLSFLYQVTRMASKESDRLHPRFQMRSNGEILCAEYHRKR